MYEGCVRTDSHGEKGEREPRSVDGRTSNCSTGGIPAGILNECSIVLATR